MNQPTERRAGRRWARLVFASAAWVSLGVAWIVYQRRGGLGPVDTAQELVDAARGNWWAIVAYLVISLLRPLVMFPATVVTVAAGLLFGPVVGVAVAAVSANASALIAHAVGRSFSRPDQAAEVTSRLGVWAARLRGNGFEAVLLMRLLFLPYDLVSYACGLLRVHRGEFLAANAIGTLPGTVAFVLIGASITRLDEGFGGIDPVTLSVSVVLVVASIVASRVIKRRQRMVAFAPQE